MKDKTFTIKDPTGTKGEKRMGQWQLATSEFAKRSFVDEIFENLPIFVDGSIFTRCQFDGCQIVFSASAPVVFDNCQFNSCDWSFAGSADLMLRYLSSLYHGLGPGGREVVDLVFKAIHQGRIGQEELITPDVLRAG